MGNLKDGLQIKGVDKMIFNLIIESKEICRDDKDQMHNWSCGNHDTIKALWDTESVEFVSVIRLVDLGKRCGCELLVDAEKRTLTICDDSRAENI